MRLNIPNNKEKFEHAPFVESMTHHQCKVMINRIFHNLKELANVAPQSISFIIDDILDGKNPNFKSINHINFFKVNDKIIVHNANNDTIRIKKDKTISIPYHKMDI